MLTFKHLLPRLPLQQRISYFLCPSPSQALKMSTFTLPDSNVEVKLIDGLSREELLGFPAFKACELILTFLLPSFQSPITSVFI
jgi:hypothetical protein